MSTQEFKAIFRGQSSGVAVITTKDVDGRVDLTVSPVASVSAEPPLLVFSDSGFSSASAVFSRSQSIVEYFLDAEDIDVADQGASGDTFRFDKPQN